MNNKYEKNFLYRLIKVSYVIALIFSIVVSVAMSWESIPERVVDRDKSTITCISNNKTYSLRTVNMYGSLGKPPFTLADFAKGSDFCLRNKTYKVTTGSTDWKVLDVEYNDLPKYGLEKPSVESMAAKGDYSYKFRINIVEKTIGNWINVGAWLIFGISISYTLLSIIRETLNYVFLGKPFDFEWVNPKHKKPQN
jgi:hypothetical protein